MTTRRHVRPQADNERGDLATDMGIGVLFVLVTVVGVVHLLTPGQSDTADIADVLAADDITAAIADSPFDGHVPVDVASPSRDIPSVGDVDGRHVLAVGTRDGCRAYATDPDDRDMRELQVDKLDRCSATDAAAADAATIR